MRHHLSGYGPIDLGRPAPAAGRESSDEALVAKVAAGNRLAMHALLARHYARVYRFVLRLIGNKTVAEDVTSEAFLCVCSRPIVSRRARPLRPDFSPLRTTKP
jgi:Sigma-70 region 2